MKNGRTSGQHGQMCIRDREKADFDITLTGSSDDWDESIAPFAFHCTFGDEAAQTQQEPAAEQAAPTYMLYDGTATKSRCV